MSKSTRTLARVTIRPATSSDLDGIMSVEEEKFGTIDETAMASREQMTHRIKLCNTDHYTWFWVAVQRDKIVGYVVVQPTDLTPDTCQTWDQATDGGKLTKTFNPLGVNLYGVSVAASESAPEQTSLLLLQESIKAWKKTGKKYFMFCCRMPGYAAANEGSAITIDPNDYWQWREPDGGPKDHYLRFFWQVFGADPVRLLKDGYPPDQESGGHGVLFAAEEPQFALQSVGQLLAQRQSGKEESRC